MLIKKAAAMACFLCFTSVFGMMDNQLTLDNQSSSPFLSSFSSQDFTSSTTDNNNSSQSFSSSVPSSFLKDDRKFILAKRGRNRRGKPVYKCLFCKRFLYFVKGTSYQCCICRMYFTVNVRYGQTYFAMSTKSSSAKQRIPDCECSVCGSYNVYFVGLSYHDILRCICADCDTIGLYIPSKNPATSAQLVEWSKFALKQYLKRQSASKLVLDKLRNSTK
jgi:hypothetical protein